MRRSHLEPRHGLLFDTPASQTLDCSEKWPLIGADQRHCFARRTRAASAANAVHIVLRNVRQVEVHDVRQGVNINSARCDIGGHQHLQLVVLEAFQGAGPRVLALVAVDRVRLDSVALKLLRQTIRAVLGLGEHQHLLPVAALDEVREQRALAVPVHRMHDLRYEFDRAVARGDFDGYRVAHEGAGQLANLLGKCRGEQQILAGGREQCQDATDVGNKSHVEHAVGLVEHEDLHLAQVDGALLNMIEQTPGCGDDNVGAAPQLGNLGIDAHAAEYDG